MDDERLVVDVLPTQIGIGTADVIDPTGVERQVVFRFSTEHETVDVTVPSHSAFRFVAAAADYLQERLVEHLSTDHGCRADLVDSWLLHERLHR